MWRGNTWRVIVIQTTGNQSVNEVFSLACHLPRLFGTKGTKGRTPEHRIQGISGHFLRNLDFHIQIRQNSASARMIWFTKRTDQQRQEKERELSVGK